MKKHIIIIFALSLLAFTVQANQKKADVPEQDFGFTQFASYNPSVSEEIRKEIAPTVNGLSRSESLGMVIAGSALIALGITGWVSGIVMVYFSAIGLGWITSDRYKVRFLNEDQTWGLLGIGFGYGLIGLGVALCAVGVILLVYGILKLTTGDEARLFMEPGNDPNSASLGLAIKL